MRKEIYFCDECEKEKSKEDLFCIGLSIRKATSDTVLERFNKEICISCIKGGNVDNVKNLGCDLMKSIRKIYKEI